MTPRLLLASLTLCGVAVLPAYAQDPAPTAAPMPAMPMATPTAPQFGAPPSEMPPAAPIGAVMQPPAPRAEPHFRPLSMQPTTRPEPPAMPERPEMPAAPAESAAPPSDTETAQERAGRQQYLDAVREQRRVLMDERSKAWREAAGANRTAMMPPWGDAMHEQRQQEMEQRREAMEQYTRQRQEEMRAHRYWTNPYSAYINELNDRRREAMDDLAQQRREQMDKRRDEERRMMGAGPWGYPSW